MSTKKVQGAESPVGTEAGFIRAGVENKMEDLENYARQYVWAWQNNGDVAALITNGLGRFSDYEKLIIGQLIAEGLKMKPPGILVDENIKKQPVKIEKRAYSFQIQEEDTFAERVEKVTKQLTEYFQPIIDKLEEIAEGWEESAEDEEDDLLIENGVIRGFDIQGRPLIVDLLKITYFRLRDENIEFMDGTTCIAMKFDHTNDAEEVFDRIADFLGVFDVEEWVD